METKSKRYPPAPRKSQFGTVFKNDFGCFEVESQAKNDGRGSPEIPCCIHETMIENVRSNRHFVEAKKGGNAVGMKQVERDETMSLPSSCSSEMTMTSHDGSNDHAQSEGTTVHGDDLALRSDEEEQGKDTIDNTLTCGWALQESDLLCMPLALNKVERKEDVDCNNDWPLVPFKRNQRPKGKKVNARRFGIASHVQTLVTTEKIIDKMRETIEEKGLAPCDVYPDGNCMFAAVVDQLRVRGDFSFTANTLRQAATKYLTNNPITGDGTSLEMFLTDGETWEDYLLRMSGDGEWGDHIILGALANVIQMQIIIYGGETGERETIVCPEHVIGEADLFEQFQESVIYLGHVSESHYISLRPKHWRQDLDKDVQHSGLPFGSQPTGKGLIKCPIKHLNTILRQIFRLELIKSFRSDHVNVFVPNRFESKDIVEEAFGSLICKLVPCKAKYVAATSDIRIFVPDMKMEEERIGNSNNDFYTLFVTPYDSDIVSTFADGKVKDLVAEEDIMTIGHLKLIPKRPKIWRGQTMSLKGNTYVKTFDVNFDRPADSPSEKISKYSLDMHHVLAFRCPWPDVAQQWANRYRESGFPDDHVIENVISNGCHVIPVTLDARMADVLDDSIQFMTLVDDYTWCYTFAAAEKEICRFLSSEQRQSFLIFKSFVDVTLQEKPLPASVVNNIFFYALENIQREDWKSKPSECFFMLLRKMVDWLKNRQVPHYFMPGKNLLQFLPEEVIQDSITRFDHVRHRPVVHLYFLLDHLNVMPSGIGRFVEEILENIEEETEVSPTRQTLDQAFTELLKDLLLQENYQAALLVFQDMVKEKGISLETYGIFVLEEALWDMSTNNFWCFALYMSITQKSRLLEQLCNRTVTVPVTEVFGPECIYELPCTVLPECFSIIDGNLPFAAMVFRVLFQAVSEGMFVKCITYYLTKYGELAGDSLILPNKALVGENIKATKEMQHVVTSTSYLCILNGVYVALYNLCRFHRIEEFREMLPNYILIAESLSTPETLRNITIFTKALDESKRITSVLRQFGFGKETNKSNN